MKIPVTISLDKEIYQKMKEKSKSEGWIISKRIENFLKQELGKANEKE